MAFLITFEGIEGCGKTTQSRLLTEYLRSCGLDVLATREPGGCAIADSIRSILLDAANTALTQRAELLLYAAARAQHVDEVIRPALAAGTTVICDRFIDATLAYQGDGRNLDSTLISDLNRLATGGVTPDLTLLLDLAVTTGLSRAQTRNAASSGGNEDRFERESLEFHRRVRRGYQRLATENRRFRVIDATGSPDEVFARIRTHIDSFLALRQVAQ